MKFVLFGNDCEKNAAIRYRVQAWARRLADDGHAVIVCLPGSVRTREQWYDGQSRMSKLLYLAYYFLLRIAQLRHVIGADAVFFRGPVFPYGPPLFEHFISILCPRMVFDIDDALWEPPVNVDSPFLRFVDFGWVDKMCRLCRRAIVGNRHLSDHVSKRMAAENVVIIPTCIDMSIHTEKTWPPDDGRPVVLGWTGLRNNLAHLRVAEPAIQALAKKYNIVLSIATGGGHYELDGVTIERHEWKAAHEIDYLRNADIGLMPLEDSPRARGKCAFKALQHMAVGTPCVISPVGMNTEIVEDGVTGYFATTTEEWQDRLERMICDAALRERMGRAARETVLTRYAHEVHYPAFRHTLETLGGKP
jgi:glycosyltransferase involved in cell wall biosynthesis